MRRTVLLGALLAGLLAPFAIAQAHGGVSVSVSTPDFGFRIGAPVYRPAPVIVAAPVYAPPVYAAPVYVPRPVYVAPRVIYAPPVVVPRYYAPRAVVVAPRHPGARVASYGYGHRHWKHRRDHDRNDHRGYRAGYGF